MYIQITSFGLFDCIFGIYITKWQIPGRESEEYETRDRWIQMTKTKKDKRCAAAFEQSGEG